MTIKAPTNPEAFEARVAAVNAEIAALEQERGDLLTTLAKLPDDAATNDALIGVEQSLDAAMAKAKRLRDAQAEAARRYTTAARREYVAGLRDEARRVLVMRRQLADRTAEFVAVMEPLLAAFVTDVRALHDQSCSLAFGVVRAGRQATGSRNTLPKIEAGLSGAATTLHAALWRAGLQRLPELRVSAPPPLDTRGRDETGFSVKDGKGQRKLLDELDLAAFAHDLFDREDAVLRHALDTSLAAVEGEIARQEAA